MNLKGIGVSVLIGWNLIGGAMVLNDTLKGKMDNRTLGFAIAGASVATALALGLAADTIRRSVDRRRLEQDLEEGPAWAKTAYDVLYGTPTISEEGDGVSHLRPEVVVGGGVLRYRADGDEGPSCCRKCGTEVYDERDIDKWWFSRPTQEGGDPHDAYNFGIECGYMINDEAGPDCMYLLCDKCLIKMVDKPCPDCGNVFDEDLINDAGHRAEGDLKKMLTSMEAIHTTQCDLCPWQGWSDDFNYHIAYDCPGTISHRDMLVKAYEKDRVHHGLPPRRAESFKDWAVEEDLHSGDFDAEYVRIVATDMEDFLADADFTEVQLPGVHERVFEKIYGRGPDGNMVIRVYTSVVGSGAQGGSRDRGKDAIRVVPVYQTSNGDFYMRRHRRVHRVTGWRRNLGQRIEEAMRMTPGPVLDSQGRPMILRKNRQKGTYFWGAIDYPASKETRPYRGG